MRLKDKIAIVVGAGQSPYLIRKWDHLSPAGFTERRAEKNSSSWTAILR